MPFTASHVAAVLPFTRAPLIPSALVIGSIVPDLHFYLPLPLPTHVTHSVPGVFGLNAASGLVALLVWHLLLAEPLYATSPQALRRRLPRPEPSSLLRFHGWHRRFLLTYLSLVLGSATHIFWDSFTHPGTWGSEQVGWLSARQGPLYGAEWAHYASTVIGAAVIAMWLLRWWRETPPHTASGPTPQLKDLPRLIALVIPLLMGATVAITTSSPLFTGHGSDLQWIVFSAVTRGVGTTLAITVLFALIWQLRRLFGQSAGRRGQGPFVRRA